MRVEAKWWRKTEDGKVECYLCPVSCKLKEGGVGSCGVRVNIGGKLYTLPPTPVEELIKAYNIGKEAGLEYVFVGNLPGNDYESTYCPKCGNTVIGRAGYFITGINLKEGKCKNCGYEIKGVWEKNPAQGGV